MPQPMTAVIVATIPGVARKGFRTPVFAGGDVCHSHEF